VRNWTEPRIQSSYSSQSSYSNQRLRNLEIHKDQRYTRVKYQEPISLIGIEIVLISSRHNGLCPLMESSHKFVRAKDCWSSDPSMTYSKDGIPPSSGGSVDWNVDEMHLRVAEFVHLSRYG
jgi:hypothetical protein